MSTATMPRTCNGGDDARLTDFLRFAALTRYVDLAEPEGPVREHRPHRSVADRRAIEQSLRGDV
jgi:hypothetical protein